MIFKPASRRIFPLGGSLLRTWRTGLLATLLLASPAIADTKPSVPPTKPPATEPSTEPEEADDSTDLTNEKPFMGDLRTRMMEDLLRMREFFDTTVPGTLKKYKLVFGFSPRSADVTRGEFIRVSTLLRYGLRDRWELYGGVTPYVPNPFNGGNEARWGMGEGKAGVRYNWGHWGPIFDKVTVGFEVRTPLGSPPPRLIDRYTHIAPFINASRPLPFDDTTLFANFTYDRAVDAPWRSAAPVFPLAIQRHVFIATHSVLYKPNEFGGIASYSFRHFRDRGLSTHLGHEIKIGAIWDVPLWRTQSWGLPGKWQIEVSPRVTFEEGLKTDKGVSVRVRWRTSVREVFSKKSYERKPRP